MTDGVLERTARIVRDAAGLAPDEPLDRDTALVGGGVSLDSVVGLQILIELEREFSVELDAEEMAQAQALRTLGTLADFVARETGGGG